MHVRVANEMNQKLIMCVDDNLDIRDLITIILEEEGFAVISSPDGESALELIREHKPELILLDVMMPGLSGLEVLRKLRCDSDSAINKIPIILVTAKSQTADLVDARSAGATSYIVKPFIPEALIEKVQSLLVRKNSELIP